MDTQEQFESLIKKDWYQVFLFASRTSIPFSFAIHPWFVINKKGVISRWGVGWKPAHYHAKTAWGHVGLNVLPPLQGLRIFYFSKRYSWKANLLGYIEGGEGSITARMIECIEASPRTYPYRNIYHLAGPNSNTYVQWVLNHFPGSGLRLPWNSFGKHFGNKS